MKHTNKIIIVLAMWLMLSMQKTPVMASGSGSLLDPWQIFTVDDLKAIGTVGDWDDAYVLMNDLNLSSEDWIALGTSGKHLFSGSFDGSGHQIIGLTIDLTDTSTNPISTGLFYGLGGASIKNLIFSGVNIQIDISTSDLYAGTLAGYAQVGDGDNLLIDHVAIGGTMKVKSLYGTNVQNHRFVGGMIGEVIGDDDPMNASMISNNSVRITLSVVNLDKDKGTWDPYIDEYAVGGFVGHAVNTLFQSSVLESSDLSFSTEAGFDYGNEFYLGGIVGLYSTDVDFNSVDRAVFLDSTARSSVIQGTTHTGGIIGAFKSNTDNHMFEAAVTDSMIIGHYRTGGIIGYAENLTIENARIYSLGMNATTKNGTYSGSSAWFGGVIGSGVSLNFDGIVSIDDFVFRTSDADDQAGSVGSIIGQWFEGSSFAFITAKNIDIIGSYYVGGLFGNISSVSLDQAMVNGAQITGVGGVGGIVGGIASGTGSTLKNIFFYGAVKADSQVGGLAGSVLSRTLIDHAVICGDVFMKEYGGGGMIGRGLANYNGEDTLTITESYVRANVHYTYDSQGVGGILGGASTSWLLSSNPITMTDVYYAGKIILILDTGHPDALYPEKISPILGWDVFAGNHLFTHVYYDSTLYTGPNNTGVGTAKTTQELKNKSGYDGFDFTGLDHWFIYSDFNDGYATFNPGLVRIDFLDSDGTVLDIVVVDPNTTLSAPEAPVLKDQVFLYWTDESDQVFDFSQAVTESIVLKANYKEGLPNTGETGLWIWILGLGLGLSWLSRKKKASA